MVGGMKNRNLYQAMQTAYTEAGSLLGNGVIDEMAVPSYLKGNCFSRLVFRRRLRHVLRLAHLASVTRAFDFGCGTGVLLPWLADGRRTVFATDLHMEIAQKLVAILTLKGVEFVAADQWQEIVPEGQIDVIVAADVIEHIEDRRGLLSLLAKKLAPTGRIVVSGPTENWLYRLGRRIVGFSGDYHVTTIRQIAIDAQAIGLRQVESRSFPLPGPCCLFQIMAFEKPNY
jgi:cyclopropane fatty-acyl-phospholipid synthase-like methyltransferase